MLGRPKSRHHQSQDRDFLVFSAYKLFGGRGSFMYGKREPLDSLSPYGDEAAPATPPEKWEVGSRDPALFASLSAVMEYLSWIGGLVDADFSSKLSGYRGRARNLKGALMWIDDYEMSL